MGTCDRCGARAQATIILPSGAFLAFCGHHTNEHEAGLITAGALIDRPFSQTSHREKIT